MAALSSLPDPTKPVTFSAVFKNVSAPTVVDKCLYCNLVSNEYRNLVITRGCYIDIYTLKKSKNADHYFNWIHTSCVYEEICDIVSVRFVGDELDSLLLSFSEAKLAIVSFDAENYELKTLSLHNYECENLKSGRIKFLKPPILRVDPLQRCAVLLVYDRHIAVLPFRRCETLVVKDNPAAKSSARRSNVSWERRATAPLLASFTTCLSTSTGEKINNVIDMQFLYGFYEPTLLILYESIGTWAGRVSARRDTCCIVALSFNLQKRTNPVIWFQESLPYDCRSVHPIPQPVGGVVILATNSIIYLKQTLPSCGIALNCYAQITTNFPLRQEASPSCDPLTLDGCRAVTVGESQLLLVAGTGKIYSLSLWLEEATQTVTNLLLHEIGCSVPPNCIALTEPCYLFIGSRLCDSMLLRFNLDVVLVSKTGCFVKSAVEGVVNDLQQSPVSAGDYLTDGPESENQSNGKESTVDMATNDVDSDKSRQVGDTITKQSENTTPVQTVPSYVFGGDDVELYGPSILNPPSNFREIYKFEFQTVDRLVNFGPMGLLTSGEVACLAPGNTDPSDEALAAAQADMQHVELIASLPRGQLSSGGAAGGEDPRVGGLLFLHSTVRPRGLTAFELPEYVSLWSLYGPPIAGMSSGQKPAVASDGAGEPDGDACEAAVEVEEQVPLDDPVGDGDGETTGATVSADPVKAEGSETDEGQEAVQPPCAKRPCLEEDSELADLAVPPSDCGTPLHEEMNSEDKSKSLNDKAACPLEGDQEDGVTSSFTATEKKQEFGELESEHVTSGPSHSYLLLTREDSTMILEVSHEIVELEVSGFNTTEMTVAAVNLGEVYITENRSRSPVVVGGTQLRTGAITQEDNSKQFVSSGPIKQRVGVDYPYILQVSPTSLRLLDGPQLIEYVQVTFEWRIHLASSADPYVLLCTEEDELFLVRLRRPGGSNSSTLPDSQVKRPHFLNLRTLSGDSERRADGSPVFASTPHLDIIRPKVGQVSAPACFCLYQDRAGNLKRWLWSRRCKKGGLQETSWGQSMSGPTLVSPTARRQQQPGFFPPPQSSLVVDDGGLVQPKESANAQPLSTADEEDLLLYGELVDICKQETGSGFYPHQMVPSFPFDQTSTSIGEEFDATDEPDGSYTSIDDTGHSTFAFIVFTNGVLEIYSLPEFTLLYEVHEFSDFPSILVDHRAESGAGDSSDRPLVVQQTSLLAVGGGTARKGSVSVPPAAVGDEESIAPAVLEITVFPVGRSQDRPVLIARTTQEVAFFEALCPSSHECHPFVTNSRAEEPLRWRRLPIPCLLTAPRRVRADPKIADVHATLLSRNNLVRPFEDIGGHRGVFISGSCPIWLFGTDTGQLRTFPHANDGVVGSLAPLNTTICPRGFVYFTYTNEMRLATLPPGYSYRENLGMRWVPLDMTPHFVQYHVESKTYAVVGTRSSSCASVFRLSSDGNKEEEHLLRPTNCVLPLLHRYRLQLYASTVSARLATGGAGRHFNRDASDPGLLPIPNTVLEFSPWEVVTSVVTAQLASEQTFHGSKDYLAIAANLSYGEEIPVRGRILILDLIDVVPEPGQPLTRHKLKTIYDGEQKGPVTALASCRGHLLSAIGQKVYIWTLKNADLVGVAFVDSELHIHSLLCVKNLVLAADVLKSIQVLRFQSDLRVLSVVSRDSIAREVFTSNFFVDGRRLGFLVTDEYGNVVVYSYDPLDPSSRSGRHLVRRVDMCLPSLATTSLRVSNRLRHALTTVRPVLALPTTSTTSGTGNNNAVTSSAAVDSTFSQQRTSQAGKETNSAGTASAGVGAVHDPERLRHSVYLGTQSGAIYLLGPIRDKMYSRLRITEKNLLHHLGPTCGLPPRLCRPYRPPHPELVNPCGQVADADLLWRYLVLPHSQRLEIAQKSGQSLEGIMDDIAELNATTLHF